MDKTSLFLSCPTKQDIVQGKVRGQKIQKDCLTLALVVHTTCIDKLTPMIIYKCICPSCSWKVVAIKLCVVVHKLNAWMALYVFASWMMSLNVRFKYQKQEALLIMDNSITHSLEHVGRGESFSFSTLQLSNITIAFSPPNVTSVVQHLDQVIFASFKIQYKKKLLEWVPS